MYPKAQVVVAVLAILFQASDQQTLEADDLAITYRQKQVLDKFRALVSPKVPHEWMKRDIALIRWLRAKDFDIPKAEKMLLNNLEWRKRNKIDTILKEDWTDFEEEYRFGIQGCDKKGRPVVSVPVGDWDVRKAVISGQSQRLMRFFDKLFEEVSVYIRTSQDKGENITQYNFIFEMSEYNLVLQGCPLCIPVYIHFFQSYENNYPGSVYRTTAVNVPQIFLTLWDIVSPVLSKRTRDTITLYGKDKKQWQSVLLRDIDKTHLTKEFGGLKEEPKELEEVRDNLGHLQCSDFAWKP